MNSCTRVRSTRRCCPGAWNQDNTVVRCLPRHRIGCSCSPLTASQKQLQLDRHATLETLQQLPVDVAHSMAGRHTGGRGLVCGGVQIISTINIAANVGCRPQWRVVRVATRGPGSQAVHGNGTWANQHVRAPRRLILTHWRKQGRPSPSRAVREAPHFPRCMLKGACYLTATYRPALGKPNTPAPAQYSRALTLKRVERLLWHPVHIVRTHLFCYVILSVDIGSGEERT